MTLQLAMSMFHCATLEVVVAKTLDGEATPSYPPHKEVLGAAYPNTVRAEAQGPRPPVSATKVLD